MQTEKAIEKQQTNEVGQEVETLLNIKKIPREILEKMLIEKGECTIDEISKLEDMVQAEKARHKDVSIVDIKNPYDRGKFPSLKRAMSQHRWSRRLATRLFGWKWKKVKKQSSFL